MSTVPVGAVGCLKLRIGIDELGAVAKIIAKLYGDGTTMRQVDDFLWFMATDAPISCEACSSCVPNYPFMRVCPTCGNKRCPHASYHANPCTGSNETGQFGSD